MEVSVQSVNGVLQISIDGVLYAPLSFRSFRPEQRNISEFYQSGIRLMSILMTGINCTLDVPYSLHGEIWVGPKEYDYDAIDRQMTLFLENAPDAYFNIMLQLDTRQWYLDLHPEYSNTFYNLVEMAAEEGWRRDVCEYLQDVIAYLEEKYGDRIFSYSLFCGGSTEWYTNSQGYGKPDCEIRFHPLKEKAYRAYVGDPAAQLPAMEQLQHTTVGVFRDPRQDREALDYWHFHHETIGEAIEFFAAYTKKLLDRKKLVCLYYGYIFPLNNTRLLYEGHLACERVLACPDIDIIFAPASYEDRAFTGTSGFLNNVDSVLLHNKMQFHEVDHTTYIAPSHVESGRGIPGSDFRLKDGFQSRMLLRRELCMCLAKRIAMWWFDFFGGYYYAPDLMEEVTKLTALRKQLQELPMKNASQIAVLSDPESVYYVSEFAKINNDCLTQMYDHLGRMGAPFDLYNFNDLETMDTAPYRLFILLNVFRLTKAQRQMVEEKLKRNGNHVLWLYAPGYLSETGCDIANIESVTGMTMEEVSLNSSLVCCEDTRFGFQTNVAPLFAVTDPDAEIWGRYAESGAAAVASKPLEDCTSYYCAVGNLSHRVLRKIVRNAGVHIYYEGDDPVYVNDRLLAIHAVEGGSVTLHLPRDCTVEELFDGGSYATKDQRLTVAIPKGEVKLFLLAE